MQQHFIPVDTDPKIRQAFLYTWQGFGALHQHAVYLIAKDLKGVTMRAQPIIDTNFFFPSKRAYKIEFQPGFILDNSLKLNQLPYEVLVGWMAHEFGHLMDYVYRSWYDLAKIGFGYATFPIYRSGMERRADLLAIDCGYGDYIIKTKNYLLESSNIPMTYKVRLDKYYMTLEEVQAIIQKMN